MVPASVIWKRKFPEGHRVVIRSAYARTGRVCVWNTRARACTCIQHIYVSPEAERVCLPSSRSTYTRTMTTQWLQINVTQQSTRRYFIPDVYRDRNIPCIFRGSQPVVLCANFCSMLCCFLILGVRCFSIKIPGFRDWLINLQSMLNVMKKD